MNSKSERLIILLYNQCNFLLATVWMNYITVDKAMCSVIPNDLFPVFKQTLELNQELYDQPCSVMKFTRILLSTSKIRL
jgi:hypothetical protein